MKTFRFDLEFGPKKIPDFFLFNSKTLSSKKINSNTNYRKLSCDNHIYNINKFYISFADFCRNHILQYH